MGREKIALVGFRLNRGGAERVMATLSNFFESKGFKVYIIIVLDDIKYPHSGTVINLGKLKGKTNGLLNKIKRFHHFNKCMKQNDFDFIIDFRFRRKIIQELLIAKFVYRAKTMFTVHHSKIHEYMPNFSPLTRLMYSNSHAIVSIAKSMENKIKDKHKLENVVNIFNPIDIPFILDKAKEDIELKFDYIIGAGHFDTNIKQFDLLIKAYAESILPKKEIHLVILGVGKLKEHLLAIARELNVEQYIHLIGFKDNPFKYMRRAKYFVLSSKIEGFPMVLLEALACSTPVVAFDCQTGPNEMIINNENGLLIEDQNFNKLIEGMNTLVKDEELYLNCKKNALASVKRFSIDVIGKQWLDLINKN